MSRDFCTPEERREYIEQQVSETHPIMKELREVTKKEVEKSNRMSNPNSTVLLSNMVRFAGARKCLEVGVFTGYSSLAWALSIPEDGKVVACDISTEYTDIGKPFWKKAGVDHKIDLRIAPAVETLQSLVNGGESETFDFIYVDGDKENSDIIYELSLKLLRKDGIIAFDNSFRRGCVIYPSQDKLGYSTFIKDLNAKIIKDDRVSAVMINMADGIFVCVKY